MGQTLYRHVKTGGIYTLIGFGRMQARDWSFQPTDSATWALGEPDRRTVDMAEVAIYQGEDGQLWARPREEFEDGRFVLHTISN